MASVQNIEETLDRIVSETPGSSGLKLTVELTVYDNGMASIDGRPLTDQTRNAMVPGGSVEAWNAAHEIWSMYLRLFARRVWDRIDKQHKDTSASPPRPHRVRPAAW